jgi:hypothetical protein
MGDHQNISLAAAGKYADVRGLDECLSCVLKGTEYWSSDGSASCDLCVRGYYMADEDSCVNCFDVVEDSTKDDPGVKCDQPGSTLELLVLEEGYYR